MSEIKVTQSGLEKLTKNLPLFQHFNSFITVQIDEDQSVLRLIIPRSGEIAELPGIIPVKKSK